MTMLCALLAQGCALYVNQPEPAPTLGAACSEDADCEGALRCYHVADSYGCDLDEGGPSCEARVCSYTLPAVDGHLDVAQLATSCYDGLGYWVSIRNGLELADSANELLCAPSCDIDECPEGLVATDWRDVCACLPLWSE